MLLAKSSPIALIIINEIAYGLDNELPKLIILYGSALVHFYKILSYQISSVVNLSFSAELTVWFTKMFMYFADFF